MKLVESILRTACFLVVTALIIYLLDKLGLIDETVQFVDKTIVKLKELKVD